MKSLSKLVATATGLTALAMVAVSASPVLADSQVKLAAVLYMKYKI